MIKMNQMDITPGTMWDFFLKKPGDGKSCNTVALL